MLLLLLCLFSIHCQQAGLATYSKPPLSEAMHKSIHEIDSLLKDFQKAIQKEKSILRAVDLQIQDAGVLDYSMTPDFWGSSNGSNLTGNHTPVSPATIATLFPFPPGHFKTTTKDPWESWDLPGLKFSSSSPSIITGPAPGYFPDFGYNLNQTPTFTKRLKTMPLYYGPQDMNHSASFTRPTFPFQVPSSTAPTSLKPYINYVPFNASYLPGSPTLTPPTKQHQPIADLRGLVTARSKAGTRSELFAMLDLHKTVIEDPTGFWIRGLRQTKANRMTAATRRPQLRKHTLSKARAWVQNKQWLKSKRPGRNIPGHVREGNNELKPDQNKAKPKQNEANPKQNEVKPNQNEANPDQNKAKPGQNEAKSNQNGANPKQNDAKPNQNGANPKQNDAKPNQNGANPNQNEAKPVKDSKKVPAPNEEGKVPPGAPGDPTEAYSTFSVPGWSDILPSMSIPGIEDATLYTEVPLVLATSSTTPNPLTKVTRVWETAFTEQLLMEDEQGFLYVNSPSTIYVATTERTTNTLGEVLYNAEKFTATTPAAEPYQPYQELMEKLDEGYLTTFLLEFARITAHKRGDQVSQVLSHAEIIFSHLSEKGALAGFDREILELATKVSRMFSGGDISGLQTRANMMHQLLSGRSQYLSVEVNSILDYADLMFEDDEGEGLFQALLLYEFYPNGTGSAYDVCYNLLDKFIKPYHRLRNTNRFRKLADSILKVIATRFQGRRAGGDLVRSDKDNKRSGDMARTHRKQTTKNAFITLSLRQKLEIKRHQLKRRRLRKQQNQYKLRSQGSDTSRNLLPITKHQTRFRVVTPRQLRGNGYLNLVRPTMEYFKRRVGRPVHPQVGVLEMFPQVRAVEVRRIVEIADKGTTLKKFSRQQTPGPMRAELKRIFEESSYSDEEASLKRNLRHALRVNWHKTSVSTPSVKTSELAKRG